MENANTEAQVTGRYISDKVEETPLNNVIILATTALGAGLAFMNVERLAAEAGTQNTFTARTVFTVLGAVIGNVLGQLLVAVFKDVIGLFVPSNIVNPAS